MTSESNTPTAFYLPPDFDYDLGIGVVATNKDLSLANIRNKYLTDVIPVDHPVLIFAQLLNGQSLSLREGMVSLPHGGILHVGRSYFMVRTARFGQKPSTPPTEKDLRASLEVLKEFQTATYEESDSHYSTRSEINNVVNGIVALLAFHSGKSPEDLTRLMS